MVIIAQQRGRFIYIVIPYLSKVLSHFSELGRQKWRKRHDKSPYHIIGKVSIVDI